MKPIRLKKDAFNILLFFLIILVFAAQNSCSTTGRMTVAPENRIPLNADQPQQGTWESMHVVLEYEVVKENNTVGLIIDGRTTRRLDQIVVMVLFLDSKGSLIERETIFNSGFRTQRTKARRMEGTIERAYEVPPGTKYIAFQSIQTPYRGRR